MNVQLEANVVTVTGDGLREVTRCATRRVAEVYAARRSLQLRGYNVAGPSGLWRSTAWRRPIALRGEHSLHTLDSALADQRAQGLVVSVRCGAVSQAPVVVIDACVGFPVCTLLRWGSAAAIEEIITTAEQWLGPITHVHDGSAP